MTASEKHLISMYLVNQGLRLDMELSAARLKFDMEESCPNCYALMLAWDQKKAFDKFQHDLCALLNI